MLETITYHPIGVVRTPYRDIAPFQSKEDDDSGPFILELYPRYESALEDLECFKYVIVIFHMDRIRGYDGSNLAHPPSLNGGTVGLFASRSPNRPNPIGIDIARILKIEKNLVYTTGLSALDETPLLDIKPYRNADSKPDAGKGWSR